MNHPTSLRALGLLALTTVGIVFACHLPPAVAAGPASDPRFYSWRLNPTAKVASVRLASGLPATTKWSAIDPSWKGFVLDPLQPNPTVSGALADITGVRYTATDLYLKGNGLASYVMGPWYTDPVSPGIATPFEFRPLTRAIAAAYTGLPLYVRIPRVPTIPVTPAAVDLGTVGLWVNGTAVYGVMDGYCYSTAAGGMISGKGIWNEDAYWSEGVTFDLSGFHQPGPAGTDWGLHHAHIDPLGLRWQLGDGVVATLLPSGEVDEYVQGTSPVKHSPILGWAFDGFPIYGPYGYSDPWKVLSGVRRMRTGYTVRDGSFGSLNLYASGRTQLPVWGAIAKGRATTTLHATEYGPTPGTVAKPSPDYPLGCFAEDYDYRGDLVGGGVFGVDWDLDRSNGRFCITPDFPNGTFAYFVSIDGSYAPQFPYILGPLYKGKPSGAEVTVIPPSSVYF